MTWLLLLAGCATEPECLEPLPECTPQYAPTFQAVYTNTLEPSCGQGGVCHGPSSDHGDLVVDGLEATHARLLGGPAPLVDPGSPECSLLVQRLESPTHPMPPGAPLSEPERCAVRAWVASGAPL